MTQIIIQTVTTTIAVYFVALILTRLLGRKLISQMTFFDFVLGVALGSAIVNTATVQQNTTLSGFIMDL